MAISKREYLAGLNPPLAKPPPARGRFSRAALAELARAEAAGMSFSDGVSSEKAAVSSNDEPAPYVPAKIYSKPVVRDIDKVTGYTPEGYLVASSVCMKCCEHVSRCDCYDGIHASKIVARWSDESAQYGAPIDQLARV